MRRTALATLATLVLLAGGAGAAGAAAAAGSTRPGAPVESIGIRLLEAPADAADDPRAQLHIVDHLAPGTTISREIEVSSTAASTMRVALYGAAASIVDGTFTGADDRTANDLSTWTTVAPAAIDVPAGRQVTATVTIAVPADAPPGEQYGVVWAQIQSPGGPGTVTQVSRVGIRLYVSVGPGGAPAADFAIESLTAQRTTDGTPQVIATVRNTGGRALDLSGTLELADGPGGVRAGPFPAVLGTTLAIQETAEVTITLDADLPAGPWGATIDLRSGRVERQARATITFPASGAGDAVPTTTPSPRSVGPVIAAAVALLLVLLLAGAAWQRRRRKAPARSGARVPQAPPAPGSAGPILRPQVDRRTGRGVA